MVKIIFLIVAVFVFALIVFILVGDYLLKRKVKSEVGEFIEIAGAGYHKTLSNTDISGYPEPVQRYLRYAVRDSLKTISFARLRHEGEFKPDEDKEWLPIKGEEYFIVSRPGFIWFAKVKMTPFLWIAARDTYFKEQGNMLIKLLSSVTIQDERGTELTQAALLRYVAECFWLPTAFLNDEHFSWRPVDENAADVTIADGDVRGTIRVFVNEHGEITKIYSGDRHMTVDGRQVKTGWSGYCRDYRVVDGFAVPFGVEVEWNLSGRDYKYARFRVTDIEFNKLEAY